MTTEEKNMLTELKSFFEEKYPNDWEIKFRKYTTKLANDGHIDQEVVDEFLEDEEPNQIVKRFNAFKTIPTTRTIPTTKTVDTPSASSGCGSSSRSYGSGCGSSSRSYGSGCGSSSSSSRSSC